MLHRVQLILLALSLLIGPGCESARPDEPRTVPSILKMPAEVDSILRTATSWELLALDPAFGMEKSSDTLHEWNVLGRRPLDSPYERAQLAHALSAGIASNTGAVAACFNPRHGIRATTDEGTVDLVICFECYQLYVYGTNGERVDSVLTTRDPQRVFDRVFREAGLEIAR